MNKQVVVQVYTKGGGAFVAEVFDMVSGWQDTVRDYIKAKREIMECTHARMLVNGTSESRVINF